MTSTQRAIVERLRDEYAAEADALSALLTALDAAEALNTHSVPVDMSPIMVVGSVADNTERDAIWQELLRREQEHVTQLVDDLVVSENEVSRLKAALDTAERERDVMRQDLTASLEGDGPIIYVRSGKRIEWTRKEPRP